MTLKTFSEKLIKQFDNFELKSIKFASHQKHLYADYAELVALLYNGDATTPSEVGNRLKKDGLKENILTEDQFQNLSKAEIDDQVESFFDEVFEIIRDRSRLYSDFYPFQLANGSLSLMDEIKADEKKELYLSLLMASNLNQFSVLQAELTAEFEAISAIAITNYLQITSSRGNIKQLGKNSDYQGTAEDKIYSLAKDLNVPIQDDEIKDVVKGNQERGLDILGWIPFNDKIPNMLVVLAQCACGKEWYKKQNETKRYEEYYRFYRQMPVHAMFIPYALVKDNKGFFQRDDLSKGILLFERGRILELLNDLQFFKGMNSKKIVERCIDYMEPV